jgi:hypothetical protein
VPAWLARNVRQVCDGGLRWRGISREMVRSEMSMPSLSNSPWMQGAPHRRFLRRHPADQVPDVLGGRRATRAPARLPTPEEAKATALPADHSVGTDDDEDVGPVCPKARQPRPEDPICDLKPEPFGPCTAEDDELLTEGEVLQSQVLAGANQRAQEPE